MSLALSKQNNKGYFLFLFIHSQPMVRVEAGLPFVWPMEVKEQESVDESCMKSAASGTEITHFKYGQMNI